MLIFEDSNVFTRMSIDLWLYDVHTNLKHLFNNTNNKGKTNNTSVQFSRFMGEIKLIDNPSETIYQTSRRKQLISR
jgi:hypothetical protein